MKATINRVLALFRKREVVIPADNFHPPAPESVEAFNERLKDERVLAVATYMKLLASIPVPENAEIRFEFEFKWDDDSELCVAGAISRRDQTAAELAGLRGNELL